MNLIYQTVLYTCFHYVDFMHLNDKRKIYKNGEGDMCTKAIICEISNGNVAK